MIVFKILTKLYLLHTGVELWLEGATHKLFRVMNQMGIAQGVNAARAHVDLLRVGFDDEIMNWKKEIEVTHLV